MKSARVTLLVSPADKRRFRGIAAERGLTTSEMMRQAVEAFDPESFAQSRELAALTRELRAALPDMRKSLREANVAVERTLAEIGARASSHAPKPRVAARAPRQRAIKR